MSKKSFTLPDKEEMIERLEKINSDSHCVERFHPILLQDAGREINGMGVVLMVTMAIEEYCESLPTPMRGLMYLQMETYLKALISDEVVLEEALSFYKEVQEAAEEKAEKPEPVKACLDYDLFLAARKVATKLYDYATPNPSDKKAKYYVPWVSDRRKESVNPFYCQTEIGLILEISTFGMPHSIWTPWGEWGCWGGGSSVGGIWEFILPMFLRDLGAEEIKIDLDTVRHFTPYVGHLYQITKIDGEKLPDAKPRYRSEYSTYEDVKKVWEKFEFKADPYMVVLRETKNIVWRVKRKLNNLF